MSFWCEQQVHSLYIPDCPEPGVFGSRMIPLAANCCFIVGVPLGKGSMGIMKLRGSGICVVSCIDLDMSARL